MWTENVNFGRVEAQAFCSSINEARADSAVVHIRADVKHFRGDSLGHIKGAQSARGQQALKYLSFVFLPHLADTMTKPWVSLYFF